VIQKMKCRELRYRYNTVSAEEMSKDQDGTNLSETSRHVLDAFDNRLRVRQDAALRCLICKNAVPPESAYTDEDGQGVHEECYVLNLHTKQVSIGREFFADFGTCATIGK
jgi:hypothetical protein